MTDKLQSAYRGAWVELRDKVLDEKNSWGKEELKKRMASVLIKHLETTLEKQ